MANDLTVLKIDGGLSGDIYGGLTVTYVAADAAGHQALNDGRTFLQVKNTSGSAVNVTITRQKKSNYGHLNSPVFSIPATTGDKMFGPFAKSDFDDPNGKFQIVYGATSGVTVRAFSLAEVLAS